MATNQSEASTPALDYAPKPPWRRRKAARWVVGGVVAMIVVAAAVKWGPGMWRQGVLLYWQHQCLTYTAPAGQVVFGEDPSAVALAVGKSGYSAMAPGSADQIRHTATVLGPPLAVFAPKCLKEFAKAAAYPWITGPGEGVLFLHERRTKSGERALVIVRRALVYADSIPFEHVFGLSSVALGPAGWRGMPQTFAQGMFGSWIGSVRRWETPTDGLRFYAGQPDASDQSHFTIRYDLSGGSGMIEGWLVDVDGAVSIPGATFKFRKGSRVRLKIRDGPALGTAWVTGAMMKD